MKARWLLLAGLCLGISMLVALPAQAQYGRRSRPNYGPGYRPGLSPYLNLLRGGDPAANYYLGVRPEFERRATQQTFRSILDELGKEVERVEDQAQEEEPKTDLRDRFGGNRRRAVFAPAGGARRPGGPAGR